MLKLAVKSHVGKVRSHNEDTVACIPGDPWLVLVADGMGGHKAGEVASGLAAETVMDAVKAGAVTIAQLREAVSEANKRVYDHARSEKGCSGMGTTLVLACGSGEQVTVANVGDSRAYLYSKKGGSLRQITRDHSLIEELVSAGRMTREQAADSPFRNVITRAIGTAPMVAVDMFEVELENGDALLLCSDGLSGEVPEQKIRDVLKRAKNPETACDQLIKLALGAGGKDNISVAVALYAADKNGGERR